MDLSQTDRLLRNDMANSTAADLDALLPQTQCTRCGYDGCRPYAEAIASGEADINRCPPGGETTMQKLAALTGNREKPIDPECGEVPQPMVAFIREDECIGCTKCIQVCPVDAIVGAPKLMHTVIADECTGCELCVPACPVDCIDMPAAADGEGQVHWPPETANDEDRAARARQRFDARNQRLARLKAERAERRARRRRVRGNDPTASDNRRSDIAAAIARAKAKRDR